MTPLAVCMAATGILMLAASALGAQADPRLVAAVRQAQEGQPDSARAALRGILAATPPTDPFYPQVLYATALLAPTASEMQRTLQRVTVEHPLSMWTDDALLKLAQLEYASGNLPGTARQLERLRADFPASPVLGLAAFWAARTYFDMREQRPACLWVGAGTASLRPEDTELRNQLRFFSERCPATLLAQGSAGVLPASARVETTPPAPSPVAVTPPPPAPDRNAVPADTTRDSTPPATTPAAVTAPRDTVVLPRREAEEPVATVYRVQVMAAATRAMADESVQRLRALGVTARIVTEGAFLKVRAGEFADRAAAADLVRRLRGEFPGAFIVSEP